MKHVSILVPETAVMAAIADPRYLFTAVNQFLEAEDKPALFKVELVGLSREVLLENQLFSVHTDKLLQDIEKTDIIFIPAISGNLELALERNKEFMPRMENGKLALNKTSFELNVMLEDLIKDLQLTKPTHKLILSQNDEASVVADRDKLIQVVTNLLNNAVKYSPNADEIHIALRCHQNQVICSVQDFGVGISPEKHHTIFERFQQANDVQQFSGLGLGLYIAREIIHAEGGEIWLESILGKGSIFYFTLPADKTRCD